MYKWTGIIPFEGFTESDIPCKLAHLRRYGFTPLEVRIVPGGFEVRATAEMDDKLEGNEYKSWVYLRTESLVELSITERLRREKSIEALTSLTSDPRFPDKFFYHKVVRTILDHVAQIGVRNGTADARATVSTATSEAVAKTLALLSSRVENGSFDEAKLREFANWLDEESKAYA